MIHSCLNRLQLANNLQMVNRRSHRQLPDGPNLVNPIARFRPRWLDQAEADAVRAAA